MFFISLALLAGISIYKLIDINTPKNFEECVLHHMKGQNSNLIAIAGKLCKNEFPDRL
jgi:hypothetical protein